MGMRELIEKGNVTKHGRQFVAKVLQLQADIAQAVAMGATPAYRVTLEGAGRRAILRDLMADRAADRARIQAEIEAEKARYETNYFKDLARHDFEIRQAERRYMGMSDKELTEAVIHASPGDPNVHDVLLAELRTRDMEAEVETFRKLRTERHLSEPWLETENGAALMAEMKLAEHVEGGGILLALPGQDGRLSTAAVGFDDVVEAYSNDGKDNEDE